MSELRPKVDSHVVFERILERLDDGVEAEIRLTTGVESFLRQCDAFPDVDNDHRRAAVVHVICPGLEFVDKGKTRIGVPQ